MMCVSPVFIFKEKEVTDLREPIEHRTRHYVNLATMGLFPFQLKGRYVPGYVWTMTIDITGYLSRDDAKKYVTEYLEETHQATDITFFRKQSDKETTFHVNFKRKDY